MTRKQSIFTVPNLLSVARILLIPVIVFLVLPPVALRMIGFLYIVLGVSAPVYACIHILMDLFEQVEQAASKQD